MPNILSTSYCKYYLLNTSKYELMHKWSWTVGTNLLAQRRFEIFVRIYSPTSSTFMGYDYASYIVMPLIFVIGSDYVAKNTTQTIVAGKTMDTLQASDTCINISILGDDKKEGKEHFKVSFKVLSNDIWQENTKTLDAVIYEEGDSKQ